VSLKQRPKSEARRTDSGNFNVHCPKVESNRPKVRAERSADAVSLGVEVVADLHRVARIPLVGEVVRRRFHQKSVLTVRVSHLPDIIYTVNYKQVAQLSQRDRATP